jgi:phosphate transport system substrate-binding protein
MARIAAVAVLAALISLAPLTAQAQASGPVMGAGASFPGLVYAAWSFGYSKERGQEVRYASTGSGDGVKQMNERTVDFGATDNPLTDVELKAGKLIQFPTMAGGIVPVVNLKGVANGELKLTGTVLAGLFSGDIKTWDDARIAALNPGLALPRTRVIRVVREDASGSTGIVTEYLAKHSPAWAGTVGVGKLVKWKGEVIGVKGNDGVAEAVKGTPGAIGYASFDRVLRHSLVSVSLKNKAGQFVMASEGAFSAAVKASGISRSDSLTASLIDMDGASVWPIVDLTYVLLDGAPASAQRASASAKFFYWAFLKGDTLIRGTGFAALPTEVQAMVVRKLADIRPTDGKSINLTHRPEGALMARDSTPLRAAPGSRGV